LDGITYHGAYFVLVLPAAPGERQEGAHWADSESRGEVYYGYDWNFHEEKWFYLGDIKTAALMLSVRIVPAKKAANPKGPGFRVRFVNDEEVELGAGWLARSKAGIAYISLTLGCPSFARPIYCYLVQSRRDYALRWDRPP
jgi:uncharacterized protein (DUF736 family)